MSWQMRVKAAWRKEMQRRTGVNGTEPDAAMCQLGWYRRTFGPFVGNEGYFCVKINTKKQNKEKRKWLTKKWLKRSLLWK